MSRVRERKFCENGKKQKKKEGKRNCFEIKVIREKAIISLFTRETMVMGKPGRGTYIERMENISKVRYERRGRVATRKGYSE